MATDGTAAEEAPFQMLRALACWGFAPSPRAQPLYQLDGKSTVARDGIEPPTKGFSDAAGF
jgi:hypothetical protein